MKIKDSGLCYSNHSSLMPDMLKRKRSSIILLVLRNNQQLGDLEQEEDAGMLKLNTNSSHNLKTKFKMWPSLNNKIRNSHKVELLNKRKLILIHILQMN